MTVLVGEVAEEDFAAESDTAGSGMCGTVVGTIFVWGGAVAVSHANEEEVGESELTAHTDGVAGTIFLRDFQIFFGKVVTIAEVVGRIEGGHSIVGELIFCTDESALGNDKTYTSDGTERGAQFIS